MRSVGQALWSLQDLNRSWGISEVARLLQFEQMCPLWIPVLGHLGALQIVFQKKKKQGNVISPCTKSSLNNILV